MRNSLREGGKFTTVNHLRGKITVLRIDHNPDTNEMVINCRGYLYLPQEATSNLPKMNLEVVFEGTDIPLEYFANRFEYINYLDIDEVEDAYKNNNHIIF